MENLEKFQDGLKFTILCLEELAQLLPKTQGAGLLAILKGGYT